MRLIEKNTLKDIDTGLLIKESDLKLKNMHVTVLTLAILECATCSFYQINCVVNVNLILLYKKNGNYTAFICVV